MTAVAGRDYALIASDTRLTDGGYGVRSRKHLKGRIWSVQSSSMTIDLENDVVDCDDDVDVSMASGRRLLPSFSPPRSARIDGENDPSIVRHNRCTVDDDDCNYSPPPIFVGSAGCSSDCESLKRRMRLEIDALSHHGSSSSSSSYGGGKCNFGIRSVANLLQQVLYGRRSFPYYSFCVVAGLDDATGRRSRHCRGTGGGHSSEGAVYVYDAIGSYEKVAVACAGTGRELLQPILDRSFSSNYRSDIGVLRSRGRHSPLTTSSRDDNDTSKDVGDDVDDEGENDDDGGGREVEGRIATGTATVTSRTKTATTADVPASRQRTGVAGPLLSPVRTIVDCTWEESVDKVARAYASVSEREISVGDDVVICVVLAGKYGGDDEDVDGGDAVVRVFRYPLKRH